MGVSNWLGEVTGFEIDESVGYEYEEYVDEVSEENMKSKKEIKKGNVSIKASLSRAVNYIDKKYPDFYKTIWGDASMLGIDVSPNHHITATGLICTYLFLRFKVYVYQELKDPKYLKNITFSKKFSDVVTDNLQDGYFHIDKEGYISIIDNPIEWVWYTEKLSDSIALIFGGDFLGIFDCKEEEQRNFFELQVIKYNNWVVKDWWEVMSNLVNALLNMESSRNKNK